MPAREWRGPGAADENARGRGRDRVDVSVENWVQDFQQRRTFGKTNRYISPTSSAHVWVLRRTRARAVLAASVASPHLRPRDTHGRRSSSPVPCPHTRSSGRSALSTGGDRRLHGAWAAITTELLEAVRSQGPLAAALPRRASLVAARRVWEGQRRPRRVVAAVAHRTGERRQPVLVRSPRLRQLRRLARRRTATPSRCRRLAVADEVRRHKLTPPGRRGRGPRGAGSGAASSRRRTRGRTARR